MSGWLIFLLVICAYAVIVLTLWKLGVLKRHNIDLAGPILMIRTERGKGTIDRVSAHKKFCSVAGWVSVAISAGAMVGMLALLLWQVPLVFEIKPEQAVSPRAVIPFPGLNPYIPMSALGYCVLALIVAIVVHEFSHAISARSDGVPIKSIGLLLCLVPIGAFAEPDPDKAEKMGKGAKHRMYASGPSANLVVALVCALIFSLAFIGSVEPVGEGGVGVMVVEPNFPAAEAGIKPDAIIRSINNTEIKSYDDFWNAMAQTKANQSIELSVWEEGAIRHYNVTLADKYDYTHDENDKGSGFLGVGPGSTSRALYEVLAHPLSSLRSFLIYIGLPLQGYSPLHPPITDFYVVHGPLSYLPQNVFWTLANAFYWIFWINFAVGTFNALPLIPLDGGYMLKEGVDSLLKRRKHREQLVAHITAIMSAFVLFLIIWLILGPRLLPLFGW